jgi:hypothetical protein
MRGHWQQVAATLDEPAFERDGFLAFLTFHDVGQYVYWRMKNAKATAYLPAWLVMHLVALDARRPDRSHCMREALKESVSAAEAQGIEPIHLKGFHLAFDFYGEADARRMRDIDLLVKADDFARMRRLLRQLGYRDRNRSFIPAALRTHFTHAIEMQRQDVVIDLHRSLRVRPAYRIDMNQVWKARRRWTIEGGRPAPLSVLSDPDTLRLLLISIIQDIEIGKARAKSLVDLYSVVERLGANINWPRFLQAQVEANLLGIAVNALAILLMLCECGDRFPELRETIAQRRHLVKVRNRAHALDLVGSPKHTPRNREWYLDIYPGNKTAYLLWLVAGMMVKPGLLEHLKQFLLAISWRAGRGHGKSASAAETPSEM